MATESMLDFKVWEKVPVLAAIFGILPAAEKFLLFVYNDARDGRYTPRDGVIDFSEAGIENGLYRIVTKKTRTGKTAWQSVGLILGADCKKSSRCISTKRYAISISILALEPEFIFDRSVSRKS